MDLAWTNEKIVMDENQRIEHPQKPIKKIQYGQEWGLTGEMLLIIRPILWTCYRQGHDGRKWSTREEFTRFACAQVVKSFYLLPNQKKCAWTE
jgi:hypothetical protein